MTTPTQMLKTGAEFFSVQIEKVQKKPTMMIMNDTQTNKQTKQWQMIVRFEAQPVFTFDDFLKKNGQQQQQQLATTAKTAATI